MDNSVYKFFGMNAPNPNAEDKPAIESAMNGKLSQIVEALGFLYDAIPTGSSVAFKFVHGRVVLVNPSGQENRRVGQLLISKPTGVLDLETQGGENAN